MSGKTKCLPRLVEVKSLFPLRRGEVDFSLPQIVNLFCSTI